MYVHNLNPIIFSLGPLAVRWYGLVYVIGFLMAYWLLQREAKKGTIPGLDKQTVEDFTFWFVIISIICARLAYVFIYNPTYYFSRIWEVLFIWQGGLSFHGGLVGAVIAGLWFAKKKGMRFYDLGDLLVVPFALMLVFGRLANFINGELPGKITTVARTSWCVAFPGYDGGATDICRHPSQLYEALKNLIVFAILAPFAYVKNLRKLCKPGMLFWSFVFLYGLGRFITDFWREADPTDLLVSSTGLITGQWLSALMVLFGACFLIYIGIIQKPNKAQLMKKQGKKRKNT